MRNGVQKRRLREVTYRFPTRTDAEREAYGGLLDLLAHVPGSELVDDRLVLSPLAPEDARPVTVFEPTDRRAHVRLNGDVTLEHHYDGFSVVGGDATAPEEPPADDPPGRTERADDRGAYVEIDTGDERWCGLELPELDRRLDGHVVGLDHTGVDFPTSLVDDAAWSDLNDRLGGASNLYSYPSGEPWHFVLPSTDEEFADDIAAFPSGRGPRFEILHEPHWSKPRLHLALRTDLSPDGAMDLFPDRYGFSPPDLESYFRNVSVVTPWTGVVFGVDCYFDGPEGDWETGEWLVSEGGRIA